MGGGKDQQCYTTGYRYFAGLHLVFCHGIDKLLKIGVGDKIAWEGTVDGNSALDINQPELFGGEAREGGIRGIVDVCLGKASQGRNSYLQSILGADIPAFRGLFGLVARKCMLAANNPYIKPWSVVAQRTKTGWRDDLVDIVASDGYVDMNPAHIIREALTDTTWGGLGYPEADLDDASFQNVAWILAQGPGVGQEGLGLSLLWAKNTSVEEFIKIILQHIDGVLCYSHTTGLLKLKLVREDYTVAMLPVLDESNILEMNDFTSPADTEVVNQVVFNYVDRENQAKAVTVQDIAGIERMSGQVNSYSVDMVGIATADLASRMASRALQQLCRPIASCTLTINRKQFAIEPGDCFVLNWVANGVSNMIMRVSEVDIGPLGDGQIQVKAARDAYGMNNVSLTDPAGSLWSSPEHRPADAVRRKLMELTWWQFVREYAGDTASIMAELDDSSTFVTCFCARPSSDALNYEMWARNFGATEWVKKDTDSFPFVGTIADALIPAVESVIELQESIIDTDLVRVGTYACLGDELVAVLAVDTANVTITVARGILDTIPVAHAAGTYLWFHQGLYGLDREERASSETVEVRILPSTSLGRLNLSDATTNTHTCAGRMMRPYPPGNVKINGSRWPATIGATAELVVTWAYRDRTAQTVSLNRQDEGNIGPEAGVTYTLRIYGETGALLRTVSGLTGTSYTYAAATEQVDSGFTPARLNTALRFELESVRGSLVSLNKWNISVTRV